jgi:hypothetical protein
MKYREVLTKNGTYIAKHLRHRIISLRGEIWANQTIVCLPLYIAGFVAGLT